MNKTISITGIGSLSPLGNHPEQIWESYQDDNAYFRKRDFGFGDAVMGFLSNSSHLDLELFLDDCPRYKTLDKTVQLAILATRKAIEHSGWRTSQLEGTGVNIGSSRGATTLFETYYSDFIKNNQGKVPPLTSPSTTLGNISSWVAQDMGSDGVSISHSVTCSTALHAMLNAVAWIESGMAERFVVGGSESANTAFTLAQFKSMKLYSNETEAKYPCRSLDFSKKNNSMVISEGACVICMEVGTSANAIAQIRGVGYGMEPLEHAASMSEEGHCFRKSMKMALESARLNPDEVDVIVMHAPGTVKGDLSEKRAIDYIFKDYQQLPALTSNKWKLGHTLGASGALGIELAVLMVQKNQLIESPFYQNSKIPTTIKHVLVNAVGFGGNAVSIIISG